MKASIFRSKVLFLAFGLAILSVVTVIPTITLAGQSDVVKLKFAGLLPPKQMFSVTVDEWAAEVNKRTNGRIDVKTYHAQSLGKFPDFPKMVQGGVCELAWVMPMSKGFELLGYADVPHLVPTTAAAMEIANSLYRRGLLASVFEEKGFKPMFFETTDPYYLFFRDKKVTGLSQMQGLKMRGATPVQLQMVKALNATPVSVSPADLYMALDRKTIDGLITASQYALAIKLPEVVKYCIWEPLSVSTSVIVMNLKVWDNLPCEDKSIIQDINEEFRYRFMQKQKTNDEYRALLEKSGIEVYRLSPDQRSGFKDALNGVTQEWIRGMEAKGLPGKEIFGEAKKIVNQMK